MTGGPTPFEVHESGALLHGTKADLAIGALLVPGHVSNFEAGRIMNHVYVTETLDAAAWGAELAAGDGPGRVPMVEPTGVQAMRDGLADLKRRGIAVIYD